MASNQLIIDDDYCRAMGNYFVKQGEAMDGLVSEYLRIARDVNIMALRRGSASDAFDSYINYARRMNNSFAGTSKDLQKHINNFIKRVDAEDKYLF